MAHVSIFHTEIQVSLKPKEQSCDEATIPQQDHPKFEMYNSGKITNM